jgi:hypothetical protein
MIIQASRHEASERNSRERTLCNHGDGIDRPKAEFSYGIRRLVSNTRERLGFAFAFAWLEGPLAPSQIRLVADRQSACALQAFKATGQQHPLGSDVRTDNALENEMGK